MTTSKSVVSVGHGNCAFFIFKRTMQIVWATVIVRPWYICAHSNCACVMVGLVQVNLLKHPEHYDCCLDSPCQTTAPASLLDHSSLVAWAETDVGFGAAEASLHPGTTLCFFHWYAANRVVLVATQVTGTRSVSLQSLHVFYMPSELTTFCFIFALSRLLF
jgi:hypothetical protein